MIVILEAIIVFSAMFALDFIWAKYTAAITARRAPVAGLYASAIIVLSGTAQIGYTGNHWLLIPALLGAFAGTFAAIRTAH